MTSIAIFCGSLLILTGIAGYLYGLNSGHSSPTALIPAAFGLVLVLLGAIGRSKVELRGHLMHAAVVVALIGFLVPAIDLARKIGSLDYSAAVIAKLSMSLVCLVFVVLAVRSFVAARRSQAEE